MRSQHRRATQFMEILNGSVVLVAQGTALPQ